MNLNHINFGNTAHKLTLRSLLKFEIKSFFGRLLSPKIRKAKYKLINIGCSERNLMEGFENVGFFTARFWKVKNVMHDIRYKFPYKDNTFEGAICDNVIEHLYVDEDQKFFKEVNRILKPGSVFRVIVPDLKKYVEYYYLKNNKSFDKFENGCSAIWNLTHNWGHLSVWDYEMLTKQFAIAGFKEIKEKKFLEGDDERLLKDAPSREWECLHVECKA